MQKIKEKIIAAGMALAIALSPLKSHAQEFTKREPQLERIFDHSKDWHPFYKDIHCELARKEDGKPLIHVKVFREKSGGVMNKEPLGGYIDPQDTHLNEDGEDILDSECSDKAFYIITNKRILIMPYSKAELLYMAFLNEVYPMNEKSIFYSMKIRDGEQTIIDTVNNIVYVFSEDGKFCVYSALGRDKVTGKTIDVFFFDEIHPWKEGYRAELCSEGVCVYNSKGNYVGSIRYVYDPKKKTVVKVKENNDWNSLNLPDKKRP